MTSAIIVAAGKGTRMGPQVDKLFLELDGCPIVAHTWRRFEQAACIDEIVLVVRDGMQAAFNDLADSTSSGRPFRLVVGGKERQDSVWNGLEALSPRTEIVAIQDAARPCTSQALSPPPSQPPAKPAPPSPPSPSPIPSRNRGDGKLIERTLDRSRLWAVQTPQTFRVEIIRRALSEVRQPGPAGHRRHRRLRTDRPAGPARAQRPAQPQGHPPGGPALRRGLLRSMGRERSEVPLPVAAPLNPNPHATGTQTSNQRSRPPEGSAFGFPADFGLRTSGFTIGAASRLRICRIRTSLTAASALGPALANSPAPIIVCQNDFRVIMKRRLIYGLVVTVLGVNLLIGARVYFSSAQAAEKDPPTPASSSFPT